MCRWLYLFYTVHTCNDVLCTQPRASVESDLKRGVVLSVLPSMLDAHGPSPRGVTPGRAVSISRCSMTLLFHFLVEREELLYDFHWAKTMLRQRQSVWDECHNKCNIICHIAVHARVLYSNPPPSSLCQNELLARSHKDWERYTSPFLHTKSCTFKLQ